MKKLGFVICLLLCIGLVSAVAGAQGEAAAEAEGEKLARIEYDASSPTGGLTVPWTKEVYSFDLGVTDGPYWPKETNWSEMVLQKLNLDVTIITTPWGGQQEKMRMYVVSDTLPDCIINVGLTLNELEQLGVAGKILAIDEYFPIMPNWRKMLEDNPVLVPWLMASDGHQYRLSKYGSYAPLGVNATAFLVRDDVFKAYGIEQKWDTYDDFYTTLKKLKDAAPEYSPWGARSFWNTPRVLSYGWGTGYNFGGDGLYYDDVSDTWKYGPLEDNFKEMWKFLAKCYKDGLMDPEILTMNSELFFKHWVTDDYAGCAINSSDTLTWEATFPNKDNPGKIVKYIPAPVTSLSGARSKYRNGRIGCWENTIGHIVSSKVKNPEIIMQWLDYGFSEEGIMFTNWGMEDVNFVWYNHPEHGRIPAPPEGDKSSWDDNEFYNQMVSQVQFGKGWGFWGTANYIDKYRYSPPYSSQKKYDVQASAVPRILDPFPRVMLEGFASEVVSSMQEQLTKYNQEMLAKFLVGKESFDEWDNYVSELKNMDVDLLLDIYNKGHKSTQALLQKMGF